MKRVPRKMRTREVELGYAKPDDETSDTETYSD